MNTIKNINHIAIIPDGCRRWARKNGFHPSYGHLRTVENVPNLFSKIYDLGIHTGTLHWVSVENWKRGNEEIDWLMKYSSSMLMNFLPIAKKYQVNMIHLGKKDRIPPSLLETIAHVDKVTAQYSKHIFNYCIDYGSQNEIERAHQKSIDDKQRLPFHKYLDNGNQKHVCPDLIIRIGGQYRMSNFMLYQSAYSEWIFSQLFGPEFENADLLQSLEDYGTRQRRFGGN